MEVNKIVHVAVGVIVGVDGRILIAQRPRHKIMGGFWEFPGGKVESGETVTEALLREINEELDISVTELQPLIRINHAYDETIVLLDTWKASKIVGEPKGNEGQVLEWVAPQFLHKFDFLPANIPIINAIQLPHVYMITGYFNHYEELFRKVDLSIVSGIKLIQFRAPWLSIDDYNELACILSEKARFAEVSLLLKGELSLLDQPWCQGLHLTSEQLFSANLKYFVTDKWLAGSCHNDIELRRAEEQQLDFITLSPVATSSSHPEQKPLGIRSAIELTDNATIPVYWLGGQQAKDEDAARRSGAQGIAGISAFWL